MKKEKKRVRIGTHRKIECIEKSEPSIYYGSITDTRRPTSVFLEFKFALKLKEYPSPVTEHDEYRVKSRTKKDLRRMYELDVKEMFRGHPLFPNINTNIFVIDVPNMLVDKKKKHISLELTLETINKYQKNSNIPMFSNDGINFKDELVKIAEAFLDTPLMRGELDYIVEKTWNLR